MALIDVKISAQQGMVLNNVRNVSFDADTRLQAQEGNTLIGSASGARAEPYDATVLPAGFVNQEIGDPKVPADTCRSLYDPNTRLWTLQCEGAGVATHGDQMNYCSRPAADVSAIEARLNRLQTAPAAVGSEAPVSQAGLMFRAAVDPEAPFAAVWQNSSEQVIFQWRAAAGAPAEAAPAVSTASLALGQTHLKLAHSREGVSAFYSSDGIHWTQIGSAVAIPGLDGPGASVGAAATCNADGQLAPAVFGEVQISR